MKSLFLTPFSTYSNQVKNNLTSVLQNIQCHEILERGVEQEQKIIEQNHLPKMVRLDKNPKYEGPVMEGGKRKFKATVFYSGSAELLHVTPSQAWVNNPSCFLSSNPQSIIFSETLNSGEDLDSFHDEILGKLSDINKWLDNLEVDFDELIASCQRIIKQYLTSLHASCEADRKKIEDINKP